MRPIPSLSRKLVSASGLALATAMIANVPVARAQSFQGTVSSTVGSVSVVNGTNTTTVTVSSPSAVINWTPSDQAATGGPINFQPAGTTATFANNPTNTTSFAVLNRIVPVGSTRPIQFNGSVVSTLRNPDAGDMTGGTVFFYSPGGILLGASATFDVGNLALTTLDLDNDAAGNFDTAGGFVFKPATVAGSQVNILPGAQISAPADGSYMALVAPRVTNDGAINISGSVALVAADAATLTFSPSGLFNIEVDSGTSATGTVLANNGSITGPAASTFFHRVYMVAVPKNDAITMALGSGSTLGFAIAGAADVVGNAIVLSAGRDVIANAIGGPSAGGGTGLVSLVATDANVTSYTTIAATGGVNLTSSSATGLNFASDLFVYGDGASSSLSATAGGSVSVGGAFVMRSDIDPGHPLLGSVPQDLSIFATDGGTISFASNVVLSASGAGTEAVSPGTTAGIGRGGDLRVEASNGGQINVSGNLTMNAFGVGGEAVSDGAAGGAGIGGNASVLSTGTSGSVVSILGNASADVSGFGSPGLGCLTCAPDGGTGTGGTVTVRASGANSIGIGGITTLNAIGAGGGTDTAIAGSGFGGAIDIEARDGGDLVTHMLTANATGFGGDGSTGAGGAQGGAITLSTFGAGGGGATVAGQASLIAEAYAGSASGVGGVAAAATGGTIFVSARNEKTLLFSDNLYASGNAAGGLGATGSTAATGGQVTLDAASAGLLTVTSGTQLVANAVGGTNTGTQAGVASTGGIAQITFATNGDIQLNSGLLITANAAGSNASGDAVAGAGAGGTARIVGSGAGSLTVLGTTNLFAVGNGGAGSSGLLAQGADGIGGTASLNLTGAQIDFNTTVTLDAAGLGGNGATVSGRGLGGIAQVSLVDSTINVPADFYIGAIGSGGNTLNTGTGGSGFGGSTSLLLENSTANLLTNLTLESTGFGGIGAGALTAAAVGEGGNVNVTVNAGALTVGSNTQLFATGTGGNGVVFGDGGMGVGGSIVMEANGDSRGNSLISSDSIALNADGLGGAGFGANASTNLNSAAAGTAGGDAQGGSIVVNAAADGGTITGSLLLAQATAVGGLGGDGFSSSSFSTPGGAGGNGGSAQGGSITLDSARGTGTGTGALNFADIGLNASGTGQTGGAGAGGTTRGEGGNGGLGTGGTINVIADRGGSQVLVSGAFSANALGSGGNAGICDPECLAAGGNGVGGSVFMGANTATTTGNLVTIGGQISLTAGGLGGSTSGATGGNALGGTVLVRTDAGLALSAAGLTFDVNALGGDATSAGTAGTGRGGDVRLVAAGGSVNVNGAAYLSSQGTGGAGLGETTSGGDGFGGISRIFGQGGNISIQGDAAVLADGFGGAGNQFFASGAGGNGTGGLAALTAGIPTVLGNGSDITVGGLTFVTADGLGGDAFTAGDGFGGQSRIYARQGSLSFVGPVAITASGEGGFGLSDGSGGAGTGGLLDLVADNALEGPSQIVFGQLLADASGYGGDGGFSEEAILAGGNGGSAQGGAIGIGGGAGNGVLQGGFVVARADAIGGNGGAGNGAAGGNGGNAEAGSVQVGLISGLDTGSLNSGSATYTGIIASSTATGGAGGSGSAASPTAIGGDGGNAIGGLATLLVRGAQVTISDPSTFQANAFGGAGGTGAVNGTGGNAVIGTGDPLLVDGAQLLVTNRFNQPTQPGRLTAGDLSFEALANGGTGSVAGTSTNAGGALAFTAINSSITANSIAFVSQADGAGVGAQPDSISLTNSTGAIAGGLQFGTSQTVSLTLDQSTLTTDHALITGGNWVLGATAPVTTGTLVGTSSLVLSSGQDLVAYANLSTQGFLSLNALGLIDLGTLNARGYIEATAGASLSLDDVSSGDYIDLSALGAIATGNLVAASSITAEALGNVSTGNIAAGTGTPTGINGDLNSVGIRSGGNVATGTVFASSDFGIAAQGTISTGQAVAYDMLLLGGGAIATGGLGATNRVLIADVAMVAAGQTATGFDKELVFATTPVVSTAGAISISGPVTAAAFTAATQSAFTSGAITVATGGTGSGNLLIDAGGALNAGNLFATNALDLRSAVSIGAGSLTAQTGIATIAAPVISLGAVQAAGGIALSGQTVTTGGLTSGAGSVNGTGTRTLLTGAVSANGSINLSGGSQTTVQSALAANGAVAISATGTLIVGNVTSNAGQVRLFAGTLDPVLGIVAGQGSINAGNVQGAGLVQLGAGSTVTVGSATSSAGQLLIDAGGALNAGNLSSANALDLRSAVSIQTGTLTSQTGIATIAAPTINLGAVQAAGGIVLSGQTVATGSLATSGGSVTGTGTQTISTGAITANAAITLTGGSQVTVQSATVTNGPIAITSSGALAIGNVTAGAGTIRLIAGQGLLDAGILQATGLVELDGNGAITVGSVTSSSGQLLIDSGGALNAGNLSSANALDLRSAVSIQTGTLTAQTGIATIAAPTINLGAVQAAGGIALSGQTVTTGSLATSGGSVSGTGTQTISTGAITANAAITLTGGSQVTAQSAVSTNGPIVMTSSGGLTVGNVNAGAGSVRLMAGSTTDSGVLIAGQGTINAGTVLAGGLVQLGAGGAITAGSLRSNAQGVKVASLGGSVSIGQINARTDALISGAQAVNLTGSLSAREIIVLSGGNVSTGPLLAGVVFTQSPTSPTGLSITNATGRILLANTSMASANLLLSASTDYSALFAATPVRLGGSVNIAGQVVAGNVVSFSQGNMTGASIAAFGSIEVESGGLVTVGQRWGSPLLTIASADIRIIDNGTLTGATGAPIASGLRTSATGEIALISLSSNPALIGDGLTGSGYSLSNAEIGLISAHQLTIGAVDVAGNPVDMLIGDLTLTAGSTNNTTTLNDANGFVQFITGTRETGRAGGGIRVVGNVTGTGFAQTNIVEFTTGRFELDAATGSLSLTQSGTALGGTVEIAANNIHIASGAILDRLAVDPFYEGHVADLNRPASVQRPDGVLRALGLDLFPTGTLYIQNTGTTLDPAGFFADFELTDLTPPSEAAPASISVIVNGKWQTAQGTVSGFAARDLVVNNADTLEFFTADSAINGCAINATACVPEVPEMMVDPVPAIASQIQIISDNSLGDTPPFTPEADEPQVEDESSESAAASPIAPPVQMIDDSPLDPQSLVEQPVAGSGNPSLIGSVVNEDSAEGEAQ